MHIFFSFLNSYSRVTFYFYVYFWGKNVKWEYLAKQIFDKCNPVDIPITLKIVYTYKRKEKIETRIKG